MKQRRKELDDATLLAALAEARHPLSLRELAERVGAHGRERHELKKLLRRLEQHGRVAEVKGGRYSLAVGKPTPSPPVPPKHSSTGLGVKGTGGSARKGVAGAAPAPQGVGGRLVMHRDGYGFVIPDQPIPGMQGDVFIPPNAIGDAMHGDGVRVKLMEGQRGRRGTGRVEGRIVGVERRAHATIVGQFRLGEKNNYVQPYDDRLRQPILIPPGAEGPRRDGGATVRELDGMMVNVEITHFPGAAGGVLRGRVVEVVGKPGDFGIDVELVIRKYHLPCQFPNEVLTEARRVAPEVDPREAARRYDFRSLPIVTIDGEDAKDFDDAVCVERRPNGNYLLHVHIADVSHYVRPGAALDREARVRGTSVYFPDRAVPMLPVELSNGICSLNPQVDRLVLSCLMEINPQGEVVDAWFAEGVIRSAARMTYTAVSAALDGDAAVRERYAALVPEFEKMKELALILNAKRERRGSIDFDLPEPVIRFDARGQMVGITRSERNIAHRLIEEFMLAANETVARFLTDQGVASLYRIHEEPDPVKVLEFEEIAATFGYSLGLSEQLTRAVRVRERPASAKASAGRHRQRVVAIPERISISPRHYQRLTERIADRPEERILSYLMLRSLKQARYAHQNAGHFALAADCYTHFTSPIRRYPDLIIHRLLRWTLAQSGPQERQLHHARAFSKRGEQEVRGPAHRSPEGVGGPLVPDELEAIAMESSEAERRADDAERELIDLKKLDYMEQHLGDEFDGLVIGATKFGFWVELLELFVEGMVPLETLDSRADYYFREATRSIAPGRRSRVPGASAIRLGDRVRVRVDRLDRVLRKIQFSLLGKTDSSARPAGPGRVSE